MPVDDELLRLVAAFADPAVRIRTAKELAEALGGEELLLFGRDPELEVFLPAPGLPQTLSGAPEWWEFLDRCVEEGDHVGVLPDLAGQRVPARGCAADRAVVMVLLGGRAAIADLSPLRTVLPLCGALFRQEREVHDARVRSRSATEAMARAETLALALQQMRERLQNALILADRAQADATARARHAEDLAEELRAQATLLEEQATELELLNVALSDRTEEAETARAGAERANRAKSTFLANMSHELRTPINAILGYGEILEMEIAGPVNPDQRAHLERIQSSSRHLLMLIDDILDLAKVEAGQLSVRHEVEALEGVIDEAVSLVATQYVDSNVKLESVCVVSPARYVGDRARVLQILLNLLSNAAKFTSPGGTVTISCGTTDEPDEETELRGAERWTYIRVRDTGVGLAAEEIAQVFKPFIQIEEGRTKTRGGTGLGLTISRQLARLMGGDLTLRSERGKGSCFTLWLPTDVAVEGSLDLSIRLPGS